ncbi:sulfatase-like hydrolase/transferase [Bradyrhizobium sp. JYMT SZCCT0428]|uniref:sulfatase-like hydrolase/transferase n=1 Tax=Bradyrhizobium sp. JYMT SZCCT0428 TaxID=2807673 RepID=UPI001BA506BE|nr:sulfatase-like hydrolase/transferase [Bradyrhizobium sp. JYMT SZCCT0428]MBR1152389.1 sulfatase-like hydrolase/transferase [Bradyrhizobium sp. JYMT SZCCT0428]
MAPAPNPGSSATAAVTAGLAAIGIWRLLAVAAPQMAALAIMLQTEADFGSRLCFALSWGILNLLFIALLRRPALSGALSLTLVVVLVLLSRLKHDVVQMTANFVDLMVIDRDSAAFLFTIFPNLRWSVISAGLVTIPLMYALWWLDPFRIRRLPALAGMLACLAALTGYAFAWPDDAWRGYYPDGYLSKFARSGVTAVSDFVNYGFMESDAVAAGRLKLPLVDSCAPAGRRPHIIMVHDESSFDIRQAQGVKVPAGYGSHFDSFDGKARKFVAESSGGASWFTEYNVLAGLSSRSFGRFSYFVTRIAAGRVERGLPLALRRCGYSTTSLYPAHGAFMSARGFHTTTGIQKFYDARDLGAKGIEPDSFFYDKALNLLSQNAALNPQFIFVYLAANHFPWETPFRADLTPSWSKPGNAPVVDEYVRRQTMSANDYAAFVAGLKKKFPAQPFLIVRYGDHQPEFSSHVLDPGIDEIAAGKKFESYDPRYFTTYYAIDAINFEPVKSPAVMETVDAAYLPLVVQEAAGIPLDPSFSEQKSIMLRCKGVFYACKGGAEARRFNRLLIDAGYVKNL